MGQQIKGPAFKHCDPSSIPRTHVVEGGWKPPRCPLTSTCALCMAHVYPPTDVRVHTYKNKCN